MTGTRRFTRNCGDAITPHIRVRHSSSRMNLVEQGISIAVMLRGGQLNSAYNWLREMSKINHS